MREAGALIERVFDQSLGEPWPNSQVHQNNTFK